MIGINSKGPSSYPPAARALEEQTRRNMQSARQAAQDAETARRAREALQGGQR